jgi:mono/diheme cytochrome c family protein
MKKIILTVLITFAVSFLGLWLYMLSGMYDISQLTPHNAITKWMIKTTKHHSIDKAMKENTVPDLSNPEITITGFKLYNKLCVECHAAPGVDAQPMTKGLYPKPPVIYKSKNIPEAQEAFWIIKNGIKMTSMPAYGPSHNDKDLWALTAFTSNKLGKMTPNDYKDWKEKYIEK